MESIVHDELQEEIIEIDLENLDTLTYETLINVKDLNENTQKVNLSSESNLQLNELIESEKGLIENFHYLENLGFKVSETLEGLQLSYNGKYKASNFWAYFFGIIMTFFMFAALNSLVGAIIGLEGIKVDFFFLILTSVKLLIGGAGIVLLAKVIERTRKRKYFNLEVTKTEFKLKDSKLSPKLFPKSEYKLQFNKDEDTYHINLNSDKESIEIFNLSFSNFKLHKTLRHLLDTLNNY